jgi:hypothetical protein
MVIVRFQRRYRNPVFVFPEKAAIQEIVGANWMPDFAGMTNGRCQNSSIQVDVYPTTFRRKIIDIAVRVVRHAGRVILKVPEALWNHLSFDQLWPLSAGPPVFAWL